MGKNPFMWEENKGVMHEKLIKKYPYGRRSDNHLNNFTEYCWRAYKRALKSEKQMYVGRVKNVWTKDILEKAGMENEGDFLWKKGAKGNVLKMDKWSLILNDIWVLGGIHRHADFHLESPNIPENLWDSKDNRHIVTAREILGLLGSGYKKVKKGNKTIFRCEDKAAADRATLRSYQIIMDAEALLGKASIEKILPEVGGVDVNNRTATLNYLRFNEIRKKYT
ncbi:hypothetical protein [Xenorhabdus mauleonii]|nr:hypothetical protein [Xenorhabdus mauleonii]